MQKIHFISHSIRLINNPDNVQHVFYFLIGALFNRRMVITAIGQINLHENCDRIYRKTRRILLLELSLFLFLPIGFYCYNW